MWNEFKTFLMRGNAIELAVGIVIGAAFTAIINSIVADLINPLIGVLMGGIDFSDWVVTVGGASFNFGNLVLAVINFIIVGLVLFLIIKAMNKLMRKQKATPAPPPLPTPQEKLLGEIRDLLQNRPR